MRVHERFKECGYGDQSILKSSVDRPELVLYGWFGPHKSVRWPCREDQGTESCTDSGRTTTLNPGASFVFPV